MYYGDDRGLDLEPIISTGRWVKHTAKPHPCTNCSRTLPQGVAAYYSFHLCGEDEQKPKYGYQCPASTMNSLSCNYDHEGSREHE
jgi:hypothetical protein